MGRLEEAAIAYVLGVGSSMELQGVSVVVPLMGLRITHLQQCRGMHVALASVFQRRLWWVAWEVGKALFDIMEFLFGPQPHVKGVLLLLPF